MAVKLVKPINHKKVVKITIQDFEAKMRELRINSDIAVAVSGGPDSLALAAMCKAFHTHNKKKVFYYVHINHGIRKNSLAESKRVKKILKH